MDTTEIVSFYQFCDHFHATSRNSMYMNFISSHSNNIHALEQLRSIKDKASSSAQADKAIAEIEAKCGQKIEECKEEQRQQLMRIEDEHTLLVTQMKQEHDKRQASLIAEHNEQLKRTQL
ncbi:light-mediated development protein DET1-like isoform X2 [Glycine soja]|uniref:light-mediated development protein DET1-like isoform X2 n=1 Tax=Glycine soja TaxID=3848 RepID=UPI00103B47B6|nr:light-mediated development protein DET1-like isoform X2 [Glycine soja]